MGGAGSGGQSCSRGRRSNGPKIKNQMRSFAFNFEDLRAGGAYEDFSKGDHGDHAGGSDGEPDEPALGGFHRRSAITLGAFAARPLRVGSAGIENDAIGGAFRNF